ncbi:ATP-binding cassette subfamily C protein CydCD [Arthrobacter woluwensis]|uniref:thiol reductant ABC exporter subunit CydD n=1 Tax=Arthrobacter woluwensis TaxID=156980 RepID=UPI002786CA63|nr:thiol reductant ABC exporter subunit CydD [Arthrobacter woluwensis]MDQ0708877.1 ATP-binding cassette subfamily C protein CydCD [Arthrobacter woluwensis]
MARTTKSPFPPGPKGPVYVMGLLGAVNALGLVLLAQALAGGIALLAAGRAADAGALVPLVGGGVLGALLRAASAWGQSVAARAAVVEVKESLRTRLLAALLGGRRPAGSAGRGADALLATRRLDELDRYYTEFLPSLVNCATVPLLVGARILLADWLSALIIVLTIPLVPLFMILIGRHSQENLEKAYRSLDVLSSHLVELARGLPVLLGLGRSKQQRSALEAVGEQHRRESMATLRVAFLSALALELIATISVALVAVTIGVRLVHGQMPLEAGLLALILAPECYQALRSMGAAYHASEDGKLALEAVNDVLDAPKPRRLQIESVASATGPGLGLEGLAVTFPSRGITLGPVTTTLRPGKITALTGPSGCGKSTLLSALAGTLEPGAESVGTVLRLREASPEGSRPEETGELAVAYAPQHPEFLEERVRDELAFWAGDQATPDRLARSTRLAAADELADLRIADLSPGEQRRVALARAFLLAELGADVLLVDEPTAHLDPARAETVRASLRELAGVLPVLLVSHEPATLALAEESVPVRGGVVQTSDAQSVTRAAAATADGDGGATASAGSAASAAPAAERASEPSSPAVMPASGASVSLLAGSRWRLVRAAALGVLAQLFSIALAALSGWLIVRASSQPPILYLMAAIVGVRFFGIGRAVLRYCDRLVMHDAVFRVTTNLRGRVWEGLSGRALGIRRVMQGGNVLDTVVADVDEYRDILPRVLAPRWTAVGTAVLAVAATAFVLPAALPVTVLASLIGLVVAPAVAVRADRRSSRAVLESKSALLRWVASALQSWKDVRGNGLSGRVVAEAGRLSGEMVQAARRAAWAEGSGLALTVAACVAGAAAVVVQSVTLGTGQELAERTAVVAFMLLALQESFQAHLSATRLKPALRRLEERLTAATAPEPAREVRGTRLVEPAVTPSGLSFEDLSVAWPDSDAVFAGFSGSAEPGRPLGISGPSGSGKSTLLAALLGFLPPREGAISVRGHLAWCPQESHVFDSTVRGNLALARSRDDAAGEDALWASLERVGLADAVRSMPDGLDTRIGPGGSFLSGGQRQRLAVARTLLAGANVLLLDEPTAHLDAEAADALLSDLVTSLDGETLVVVSHRTEDLSRLPGRLDLGTREPVGGPTRRP